MLLFIVCWFALCTFVIYAIVVLLTVAIEKVAIPGKKPNFKRSERYRTYVGILCFILSLFFESLFIYVAPETNLPTAYIKRRADDKFVLTTKGKRRASFYDIPSYFRRDTFYIDSAQFVLPWPDKTIYSSEILNKPGDQKPSKGDIRINGSDLQIDLYYEEEDDDGNYNVAYPWNGRYTLEWQ